MVCNKHFLNQLFSVTISIFSHQINTEVLVHMYVPGCQLLSGKEMQSTLGNQPTEHSQTRLNLPQFMNEFVLHVFIAILTISILRCLLDPYQQYRCCYKRQKMEMGELRQSTERESYNLKQHPKQDKPIVILMTIKKFNSRYTVFCNVHSRRNLRYETGPIWVFQRPRAHFSLC